MESLIQLNEVSKIFDTGREVIAVNNVTTTINQNDFTAIIGTSGSGKSTLLSLIGTLEDLTSGSIHINGQDISQLRRNKLADFRFYNIGFIFQQFHLLPTMSVLENVVSPLFARKVDFDKKERALHLLHELGISDKKDVLPSQLSGGQQQRVAIARALINEPTWLLADEPTGNLDSETSETIFSLLKEIHKERKCGVILVTHDLHLAERSTRVIEMKDGKIIKE